MCVRMGACKVYVIHLNMAHVLLVERLIFILFYFNLFLLLQEIIVHGVFA